jgi:hypothetical protein
MSPAIVVLSPPNAPELALDELLSTPTVSAFFEIARGEIDAFWADPAVGKYLDAGAYVIARFAADADAIELQRRVLAARQRH